MFRKNVPGFGKVVPEDTVSSAADVLDAARQFLDVAGEGETVKARLRTAARELGIPFGVAKRIRYGEIKFLPTHIFLEMTARYENVLDRRERQLTDNLNKHRELLRKWARTTHEEAGA